MLNFMIFCPLVVYKQITNLNYFRKSMNSTKEDKTDKRERLINYN